MNDNVSKMKENYWDQIFNWWLVGILTLMVYLMPKCIYTYIKYLWFANK